MVWNFIQYQLLGMKWLNFLVEKTLTFMGMDVKSRLGGSVAFFIMDIIKISILLLVLIFCISYIQSYFPPEKSRRIMGRFGGLSGRIISALLGTLTPFCSCSSIPIFMGFTAAGLPLGLTFSFLISSPMVDLASLILLMSIFGPFVALLYVLSGLVIAVAGGTLIEHLHMEEEIEEFIRNTKAGELPEMELTVKDRIKNSYAQSASTYKRLIPYIAAGVFIGAFIHNWVPEEWVVRALGSKNPLGVIIATLLGIPMYSDIFGCIAISEALLAKGALLGVVLSFLMGVTTLSFPSMVMLSKVIKPKLLFLFIAICTVGIIAVGYFFNIIQVYVL